jgi:hypothetical protein
MRHGRNYLKQKGFDMDYWTWHGSTISHIPTVGWAIVSEGEVVLIRSCLTSLLKEVDDEFQESK